MPDAPVKLPSKPTVETLEQRLDGNDKAILLLQEIANRMPTSAIVDGKVDALKELAESEIAGLKELVKTILEGNKTALDATLRTQEKASDEMKSSIAKQFDSVSKRFDDLKERLDRGEGRTMGLGTAGTLVIGACTVIVAVVVVIGFVIART